MAFDGDDGNDGLDDFFNNLFGGGGGEFTPPPPPTDEEILHEAMKSTEAHMAAYHATCEAKQRDAAFFKMLPVWLEELEFYLPMLEDYEEYEQCAKVWRCIRDIRIQQANDDLIAALNELNIEVLESMPDEPTNSTDDEPDF